MFTCQRGHRCSLPAHLWLAPCLHRHPGRSQLFPYLLQLLQLRVALHPVPHGPERVGTPLPAIRRLMLQQGADLYNPQEKPHQSAIMLAIRSPVRLLTHKIAAALL